MLTRLEENKLKEKIRKIIKESISGTEIKKNDRRTKAKASKNKERNIIKWLTDNKSNNAAIAAQLWPGKDPDAARSEFSKKVRGKDSEGKQYHFTEKEINELYRIKNNFVKKIVKKTIKESVLDKAISNSIKKVLKEADYDIDAAYHGPYGNRSQYAPDDGDAPYAYQRPGELSLTAQGAIDSDDERPSKWAKDGRFRSKK